MQKKNRFALLLNYLLLVSLILASCSALPGGVTVTPLPPIPTQPGQTAPPAIVETDPPLASVIGHFSPIAFYFNQAMNQASVEAAFSGLPEGAYAWRDEATLLYTPAQSYPPNSELKITIGESIRSATGFGIDEPIELSFTVADFLRITNALPKAGATDANVNAAIVASFNQPVIPLGDSFGQPAAFNLQPPVSGRGEWINTSTYIFYPQPTLSGGTEYTVSVNSQLKTTTGVSLDESGQTTWKFVAAHPRVVALDPPADQLIAPDAKIVLTFNQPMNMESAQSNFLLSGANGPVSGTFAWNDDGAELTFTPDKALTRNASYTLTVDADAPSSGGKTLGEDYRATLNVYPNFKVDEATPYQNYIEFRFSAPLPEGDYTDKVTVTPAVSDLQAGVYEYTYGADPYLSVYGAFLPETNYKVELSSAIQDRWGQPLSESFALNFTTPPLPPMLTVYPFYTTIFVKPDAPTLQASAVNVPSVETTVESLALQDYFALRNSYEALKAYQPKEANVHEQTFDLPRSRQTPLELRLAGENASLATGAYYVNVVAPDKTSLNAPNFIVVSRVNLTFKRSAQEALVWALDLDSHAPVKNAAVTIYDNVGSALGSGVTDSNGLWQGAIEPNQELVYAVVGAPGEENFGLAASDWNAGFDAWNFGYIQNVEASRLKVYLYSDRPIYRPGQTVYFRGVARQGFNGRYQLPALNEIPLTANDETGAQIAAINVNLSPYGAFNGEIKLAEDAAPGYYSIQNSTYGAYLYFQVAEYRKPEIDLSVNFPRSAIQNGDLTSAVADAHYFFGAPAGDIDVAWQMYAEPAYFSIPGYQTGLIDTSWHASSAPSTHLESEESGKTDAQGKLSIPLPAVPASEEAQTVFLEVTVQDESGLPVSARTQLLVHPADFYIGLKADSQVGKANDAFGFEILTTDWERNPASNRALTAKFQQVHWEKEIQKFGQTTYTPVYTPVSGSELVTGPEGRARLSFTPPNAGTFVLDVFGEGARSQILVWVGGAGEAAWVQLDDHRLQLTAGREIYQPGETASVFIPNPFAEDALALVAVERGVIFDSEVIALNGSGKEYTFTVSADDAPNVYVTVTVLGRDDFRHGIVNIPVAADAFKLNLQVEADPSQAGPRDEVTLHMLATDDQGQPVQGEFSLAVVDLATLALADSNSTDIFSEYYGNQPLGVETSVSLSALSKADAPPGGLGGGGGGGDEIPFVREEFPDAAYWNPTLVTDSEGRGQATFVLPDSLTTWNIDARGLTMDTKVGQADAQLISTKPLLIRPVTPRFLVGGDRVLMAAIVNNNTSEALRVNVSLQSEGFVLDDPNQAAQQVNVPANGRVRVEWRGAALLAESADLIFTARADDSTLEDSARPVWGTLPILQYVSPQTFVTGGSLRGAATRQETISLPRTFAPIGGGLQVELSPSLAGSLTSALDAMPLPYQSSAEDIVSFILPNVEVYRSLDGAGLNEPKLVKRVSESLDSSVSRLFYLQNADGGWNWWGSSEKSDPYASAYAFFGLLRAHEASATMNEDALQRAGAYLRDLNPPSLSSADARTLDDFAFIQFVLTRANAFNETKLDQLYQARDRMSPAGAAWLALAINKLNPSDARASDLLSNLVSSAIRSSSSAHWETAETDFFARNSAIYTTSAVVYAFSQLDATSAITPDAVRYLVAHRNANKLWNVGHDNAWAIFALNAAMVSMSEVRADFAYDAKLNGSPLTSGTIAGIQVAPLTATVPLEFLLPNSPNQLTVHREDGLGRLYYNATLRLDRPVEAVQPLNQGMQIERVYCAPNQVQTCSPLSSVRADANQPFTAQLTLTLPHDAYNVMVKDFIPAGAEILNKDLKTSRQTLGATDIQIQFDDAAPFATGWGWWLFNSPQIRDESILFAANYLPAGTYVLTYTLLPLQAGEYRVLPAHAWQAFFPEVQGTSAGAIFEIKP